MVATIASLPSWPSTSARKSLSASQQATLNAKIVSALNETVSSTKRDVPAALRFLSSWSRDRAHQTLEGLIWEQSKPISEYAKIDSLALRLAEQFASHGSLDLQFLLDLAVTFSRKRVKVVRKILASAAANSPDIRQSSEELAAALRSIVLQSPGLYGIRKAAHCLVSFLSTAPKELINPFQSQDFIVSLAKTYDAGLASIAEGYGGLNLASSDDDWPKMFVQTKVDLLDSFHIIFKNILDGLSSSSGSSLALKAEETFSMFFALLDQPSSALPLASTSTRIPFNNQTLLADYQQSYNLIRLLNASLQHAAEKDARLDILESSIREFSEGSARDPGALKIILRSSGLPPRAPPPPKPDTKGKGKEDASVEQALSSEVAQVLDILSDQDPAYIRRLLEDPSYPYYHSPEKVIEALLEGTAPSLDRLGPPANAQDMHEYVKLRQNIFDDEPMDLEKVQVQKRGEDETVMIRDRAYIEEMKADILRRAEAFSDEEDEDEQHALNTMDDLDDSVPVVASAVRDGEQSGDEEEEGEAKESPQIILELAYLRDPELLDRKSRGTKGRLDLKGQTKMADEQIEGWNSMLERDPKQKDALLRKHEFAGNNKPIAPGDIPPAGGNNRGRGRGGGGPGRGRGGNPARGRAFNDKNKASKGNHSRKAGHDKKMARGGGPSA